MVCGLRHCLTGNLDYFNIVGSARHACDRSCGHWWLLPANLQTAESPHFYPLVCAKGKPMRFTVLLAVVLTSAPWGIAAAAEGNAPRPNVLIILADDLGYGDLSSFGAGDLSTPHVDRLVSDGMKFTRFYANCPVCSPTRASLLSGRYPDAVGVPGVIRTHATNSWGYLRPDAVLLPTVLKQAGYYTAMVGKWHLGLGEPNLPNLRGFEFFHGFLGDMMDDYWTHRRHGFNYLRLGAETVDPQGHATEVFTEWACQWLREYKDPAPFFLYLAYNAPHDPIQPPPEWLQKYKARHPQASEKRAKLAALIEHMDDGVGRVLAALKETARADNTLIFFTSDNGGSLPAGATNGPLSGGKQNMFEGGIRVPMCAAWPGRIKPGTHSDRVALTMDLFPTICEAAGAAFDRNRLAADQQLPSPVAGEGSGVRGRRGTSRLAADGSPRLAADGTSAQGTIDGRSILPTMLGKPQPPEDRYLFWVRLEGGGKYNGRPYYAVRHGDWKLLQNDPTEPLRLYNLKDHATETTDLSASRPEVYAELKKALDDHLARCAAVPYRPAGGIGPGEIERPQGKKGK
jgi:arylsulfatase A-like enzyme